MTPEDVKKLKISDLEFYLKLVIDRAMEASNRISEVSLVAGVEEKKHSQLRADLVAQTGLVNTISSAIDKMRNYQMNRVRFEYSMLQAKTDTETMDNFLKQAEKDTIDDYE